MSGVFGGLPCASTLCVEAPPENGPFMGYDVLQSLEKLLVDGCPSVTTWFMARKAEHLLSGAAMSFTFKATLWSQSQSWCDHLGFEQGMVAWGAQLEFAKQGCSPADSHRCSEISADLLFLLPKLRPSDASAPILLVSSSSDDLSELGPLVANACNLPAAEQWICQADLPPRHSLRYWWFLLLACSMA